MTAGLAHPGGLAALAALGPVAHIRSPAPAKSRCEERLRAPTHEGVIPFSKFVTDPSCGPLQRLFRDIASGTHTSARAGGPRGGRGVPARRFASLAHGAAMSWRDALKTAASPLAARERPSTSVVGIGQHRLDGTDEARGGGLAPTREPDPRDALKNAFAPTQPTTLELCVNVYNLHRDFTARAPLLMCALLVEVPPPTLPYKMPAAWKRAPERHRSWRVAGSTEPTRAACNASCVRFAVPVVVDGLVGGQRTLENKKAVVAVYRIPDADEADDAHIAADENLPLDRRPKLTPERLDEFEYLGEAKLRCHELVRAVHDAQKRHAEDAARARKRTDPSTLNAGGDVDFPARGELSNVRPRALVRDDGVARAPVGNARAQYALVKSAQRDPVSNPPVPGSISVRAKNPDNDAFDGAAIEVLASTPVHWPRPSPADAGRYVADFAVRFESIAHPMAVDLELVFLRLLRWVGDGYQPVYGSLVTCADIPTPTKLAPDRTRRYEVAIPTMHVPVACVKSGGATDEDDEGGFENGDLLPDGTVSWRIEIVARMRTGHDLLLGWLDLTPAELNDAGDVATVNTPAVFECDLHRGESDYEATRLNEAVGERPPTLLVTRWKLRPGANPRALRARIDRVVKTAPPPRKPEPGDGDGDEKSAPGEVGRVTVPKGANPLADFGFGPAVPKKAEEKRAKPAPAPAPAVEDSESDDTDSSRGGSGESSSSSDDENRDEAANVVAEVADVATTETKIAKTKIAKTKTARPASSSAAMPSASKKKTTSTTLSGKPRPATATATVSSRAAPPKPKLPDEAKGLQRSRRTSQRRDNNALELAPAVTPMQALLNRTLGVVVPSGGDEKGEKKNAARVFQAVKGAVFLRNKTPAIEEEEAEDEMDAFFERRRATRSKAAAAIAAAGETGGDDSNDTNRQGRPAPPGTPPEDPRDFEPNPELIAAADAAVRDAMAERLGGLAKAELVETAMRVRKELLSKCRGELRALELRRKREERAALGAMGGR